MWLKGHLTFWVGALHNPAKVAICIVAVETNLFSLSRDIKSPSDSRAV